MAALRIISFLFLVASAYATDFTICDEGIYPEEVDITDCDGVAITCTMLQGKSYDVNVTFIAYHAVNALKPTVFLISYDGHTIRLPFGDDVCSLIDIGCPIEKGTEAVFSRPVTFSGVQQGTYWLQFQLDDENGENVTCARLLVLIL